MTRPTASHDAGLTRIPHPGTKGAANLAFFSLTDGTVVMGTSGDMQSVDFPVLRQPDDDAFQIPLPKVGVDLGV